MTKTEKPKSYTLSQLLDGELKTEPNIGILETHGEPIGENKVSSDLLRELIT